MITPYTFFSQIWVIFAFSERFSRFSGNLRVVNHFLAQMRIQNCKTYVLKEYFALSWIHLRLEQQFLTSYKLLEFLWKLESDGAILTMNSYSEVPFVIYLYIFFLCHCYFIYFLWKWDWKFHKNFQRDEIVNAVKFHKQQKYLHYSNATVRV